jgi:hypothetical protein
MSRDRVDVGSVVAGGVVVVGNVVVIVARCCIR